MWRCRSLTVYDTKCDQRTKDDLLTTVTGNTPVYELIAPYNRYFGPGSALLGELKMFVGNAEAQSWSSRLGKAAWTANREEFLHVKRLIK